MIKLEKEDIERIEIRISKFLGLEQKEESYVINIYEGNTKDIHNFINKKLKDMILNGKTIN